MAVIPIQSIPECLFSRRAEHTLTWLGEELHAVNEVVAFASKRLKGVAEGVGQEFLRSRLTYCMYNTLY